jgi:hypothetical protein
MCGETLSTVLNTSQMNLGMWNVKTSNCKGSVQSEVFCEIDFGTYYLIFFSSQLRKHWIKTSISNMMHYHILLSFNIVLSLSCFEISWNTVFLRIKETVLEK